MPCTALVGPCGSIWQQQKQPHSTQHDTSSQLCCSHHVHPAVARHMAFPLMHPAGICHLQNTLGSHLPLHATYCSQL